VLKVFGCAKLDSVTGMKWNKILAISLKEKNQCWKHLAQNHQQNIQLIDHH